LHIYCKPHSEKSTNYYIKNPLRIVNRIHNENS